MRELPDEENAEEGPSRCGHAAGGPAPADDRRQSSGDRTDDRVPNGDAFQRSVDADVEHAGERRRDGRRRARERDQKIDDADDAQGDSEGERFGRAATAR